MPIVPVVLPVELWPTRASSVEGVVASVNVSPGDTVRAGDVVVEVEVEKAILAVESPYDGRVAKVLVSRGQKVRPGDPLILLEVPGEGGQ